MIELLVSRDYDGMRLDRYIQKAAGLGRNTAEKLLRKGEVRLNGVRSSAQSAVREGDTVRIYGVEEKRTPAVSFDEALGGVEVLYEDGSILAVNKPAYLPTQPMKGQKDCLSERVKNHLRKTVEEYETVSSRHLPTDWTMRPAVWFCAGKLRRQQGPCRKCSGKRR